MNNITTHARANNRSFNELKKFATIIRPSGQEIYASAYTARMFARDSKSAAVVNCNDCGGRGTRFNPQANDNMICQKCGGRGFKTK